jgi:hypothetical protein
MAGRRDAVNSAGEASSATVVGLMKHFPVAAPNDAHSRRAQARGLSSPGAGEGNRTLVVSLEGLTSDDPCCL